MKLTANEVRLGNYYFYHIVDKLDEWGEYDKVCQIDAEDFRILENFDCPEYKPIPLTEEWLLKFGFEKRDGEVPENIDFVFKGFWIEQQTDVDDFICLNTEPFVSVKYVHQLQNLYFALTGEELTLK